MSSFTALPGGIAEALAEGYGCQGRISRPSWNQLRRRSSARRDPSRAPLEIARELPPGEITSTLATSSASDAVLLRRTVTSIGPATVAAVLNGALVYVTPPSCVELSSSAHGSPLPPASAITSAGSPVLH